MHHFVRIEGLTAINSIPGEIAREEIGPWAPKPKLRGVSVKITALL